MTGQANGKINGAHAQVGEIGVAVLSAHSTIGVCELTGRLQNGDSWTDPTLYETNNEPAVPNDVADRIRKEFRHKFTPPPETYAHKTMAVSDEEWRARVDLAAAYRLCVVHDLNEGIVNHLTVQGFQPMRCLPDVRLRGDMLTLTL